MAELILGPVLRHVGTDDVTVWVETDAPCEVEVRTRVRQRDGRTFAVGGPPLRDRRARRAAEPARARRTRSSSTATPVWPLADSAYPPSVLRTIDPSRPLQVLFGSCRAASEVVVRDPTGSGEDVLDGYARRMVTRPPEDVAHGPVHARRPGLRRRALRADPRVARRRVATPTQPPYDAGRELRGVHLAVPRGVERPGRPLAALGRAELDDLRRPRRPRRLEHLARVARRDAGDDLVGGADHRRPDVVLGLPAPRQPVARRARGRRRLYARVRAAADGEAVLRAFAQAADTEADGARGALWSYRRDLGGVRLLVIDSRCGPDARRRDDGSMVGEREFAWIEEQVADGEYDHLVIGTSVPWLLPRALHDVESVERAPLRRQPRPARRPPLGEGPAGRGPRALGGVRRLVRAARQADRPGRVAARTARRAPATICVLSGDVHHTYVSEAAYPQPMQSRVYQLTCSPMHNDIPLAMRLVFKVAWNRFASRLTRFFVRFARATPASIDWTTTAGPVLRQQRRVAALRRPDRATSCSRSPTSTARSRWPSPRPTRRGTSRTAGGRGPSPRRRPDDSRAGHRPQAEGPQGRAARGGDEPGAARRRMDSRGPGREAQEVAAQTCRQGGRARRSVSWWRSAGTGACSRSRRPSPARRRRSGSSRSAPATCSPGTSRCRRSRPKP